MGIRPDRGGVTEVCSKILTPLEPTGGNAISLQGFEKSLSKIQRYLNLSIGIINLLDPSSSIINTLGGYLNPSSTIIKTLDEYLNPFSGIINP